MQYLIHCQALKFTTQQNFMYYFTYSKILINYQQILHSPQVFMGFLISSNFAIHFINLVYLRGYIVHLSWLLTIWILLLGLDYSCMFLILYWIVSLISLTPYVSSLMDIKILQYISQIFSLVCCLFFNLFFRKNFQCYEVVYVFFFFSAFGFHRIFSLFLSASNFKKVIC